MRDYDSEATFYSVIICFIICFILICLSQCATSSSFEDEMRQYKYLIVNGETYKTEDIVSVDAEYEYHSNDIIIIILKDGTKVSFQEGNYTLKDRK